MINKIKNLIIKNENNKIILSNMLGTFLIKGIAFFVSFLAVPAYMQYFNDQIVLGLWFTMLSVLSWILTFDLGIGNGLRNYLVPAFIKNERTEIKKYISSGYILFGGLTILITLIMMSLFQLIDFNLLFNISEEVINNRDLTNATSIIFIGILSSFFFKLINSILYAMQKSSLNNFINLMTNVLILVYLKVVPVMEVSQALMNLAIVYSIAINLPLLLTTIILFITKLKDTRPSLNFFDKQASINIMSLGTTFFGVQIMYMLLTTTNQFIITWTAGPQMVVDYQIYFKIFTFVSTLFALALTPVWSAVTKAISEGNNEWVNKLYRLLKILAVLGSLAHFLLIPFLQILVDIWLGNESIEINYSYAFIFAIFGSIYIWNAVLSTISNGSGNIKVQLICYSIGAVVKFPLSWIFVMFFDSWIGVVLANIIAMGVYSIVQPFYLNFTKVNTQ